MKVEYKSASVTTNYAKPALQFKFTLKYMMSQEAPLNLSGSISLQNKILAMLIFEEPVPASHLQAIRFTGEQFQEIEKTITATAILDPKLVSDINSSREQDKKRDVNLKLNVSVTYLLNRAQISYVVEYPLRTAPLDNNFKTELSKQFNVPTDNISLLFYAFQYDKYWQQRSNLVLLSSDGLNSPNNGYLKIENSASNNIEVKIPSSDWINDFAPALELGEFFVVEIPKGDGELKGAWEYVSEAGEAFRRWDLNSVYTKCREAGQLLDRELKMSLGESSFAYKERWTRAFARVEKRTSFNDQASLAVHLENLKKEYSPEEVKMSKFDAESLLIVTKALIKLASGLISEKKE